MPAKQGFDIETFIVEVMSRINIVSNYLIAEFTRIHHEGSQASEDIETAADRFVAQFWADYFTEKFPDLNIDTEEAFCQRHTGGDYTVMIDSIDGSKHFIAGIPVFSSNLSLVRNGVSLFAVVTNPVFREVYHAIRGRGAFLNGARINVSAVDKLDKSFIVCESPTSKLARTDPQLFSHLRSAFDRLLQRSFRIRNFGIGGVGLCMVARGACSAYVDLSGTTKPYDVDAGTLILHEAGGKIARLAFMGDESGVVPDLSYGLVATNGIVHDELTGILNIQGNFSI